MWKIYDKIKKGRKGKGGIIKLLVDSKESLMPRGRSKLREGSDLRYAYLLSSRRSPDSAPPTNFQMIFAFGSTSNCNIDGKRSLDSSLCILKLRNYHLKSF